MSSLLYIYEAEDVVTLSMPDTETAPELETQEPVEQSVNTDYEALYHRALADTENARRRMDEEKRQFAKYAQEGLITDLLPVIDNFYRATEHVPDEQKSSAWTTGILHIQKQLLDVLTEIGVKEITPKSGEAFDPTQHEAIGTVVNEDVPEDHIIEIKNRGYLLHDRILRPAQVIVSTRN